MKAVCKEIFPHHQKSELARYDAPFLIKNNFQILVLGIREGYSAPDPFIFIKVDLKFYIMTQSSGQSL